MRAAHLAPAMREAQWSLRTGAGALPWVRRAGQALLLGSGVMVWCWALAAIQAVWPLLLAGAWSWHLLRMWRTWSAPARVLLLCWRGASEVPKGGWHVPDWGDVTVQAHIQWDGQSAFLLHLSEATAERGRARQAWLWVPDDGGRDAHRLRTLLSVPPAAA